MESDNTMLSRRYNIAPRVLIQNMRSRHTSNPLSKVELDALVSAIRLTGIPDGFNRMSEDNVRFAFDELLDVI
jgi:hypothetical protein